MKKWLSDFLVPGISVELGDGVLVIRYGESVFNIFSDIRARDRYIALLDAWLTKTCMLAATERDEQLCQWSKAPAAHPREEHLLPLMVVAGAAGEDHGVKTYTDRVMGATLSAYQFG